LSYGGVMRAVGYSKRAPGRVKPSGGGKCG